MAKDGMGWTRGPPPCRALQGSHLPRRRTVTRTSAQGPGLRTQTPKSPPQRPPPRTGGCPGRVWASPWGAPVRTAKLVRGVRWDAGPSPGGQASPDPERMSERPPGPSGRHSAPRACTRVCPRRRPTSYGRRLPAAVGLGLGSANGREEKHSTALRTQATGKGCRPPRGGA